MSAERCQTKDCKNQARCAIKTTRKSDGSMTSTLHYDNREAPKNATRYCKDCAAKLLPALCQIIDNDEVYTEEAAA